MGKMYFENVSMASQCTFGASHLHYSKCSKFSYTKVSDKMAYANSAGHDQTASSRSTLFAIPHSILRNKCIKSKILAKKKKKKYEIKCSKF